MRVGEECNVCFWEHNILEVLCWSKMVRYSSLCVFHSVLFVLHIQMLVRYGMKNTICDGGDICK